MTMADVKKYIAYLIPVWKGFLAILRPIGRVLAAYGASVVRHILSVLGKRASKLNETIIVAFLSSVMSFIILLLLVNPTGISYVGWLKSTLAKDATGHAVTLFGQHVLTGQPTSAELIQFGPWLLGGAVLLLLGLFTGFGRKVLRSKLGWVILASGILVTLYNLGMSWFQGAIGVLLVGLVIYMAGLIPHYLKMGGTFAVLAVLAFILVGLANAGFAHATFSFISWTTLIGLAILMGLAQTSGPFAQFIMNRMQVSDQSTADMAEKAEDVEEDLHHAAHAAECEVPSTHH